MDATLDYVTQRLETKRTYAEYMDKTAREPAKPNLTEQAFFIQSPYQLRRGFTSKPLLVLFERTHCASCDELHRDSFTRAEIVRLLRSFDVARLQPKDGASVETPNGRTTYVAGWANEMGITYAPTLVFFDRTGKEIFRVDGYVRPFHLASALEYVASGAYLKEASFQRYVQARADAIRHRGEVVDLWK